MTTQELHKILDDKNRVLTKSELEQVIYELKEDCFNEQRKYDCDKPDYQFYCGEINAFHICLDLLEHLEDLAHKNSQLKSINLALKHLLKDKDK